MGKVIAVLGLGASIVEYHDGFDYTIGVNDIWRITPVDAIVCLDRRERFTPERLAVIDDSMPGKFYSQLTEWSHRRDFIHIELQHDYPNYICQIDIPALPKSMCSPFVACAIAYKYHDASEIHLFGVDLINHPTLTGGTLTRIKIHFKNLRDALLKKNIPLIVHGNGILS
jgi:hypothetical protein